MVPHDAFNTIKKKVKRIKTEKLNIKKSGINPFKINKINTAHAYINIINDLIKNFKTNNINENLFFDKNNRFHLKRINKLIQDNNA